MSDQLTKLKIQEDLIRFMKSGEKEKVEILRFASSFIKQEEKDKGIILSESQTIQVIKKVLKRNQESFDQFTKAGRIDLADKEKNESGSTTSDDSDDEFNPTLAAMESEIKPKVLKTVNTLTKEYNKLIKYQNEKLNCILNSTAFSTSKETPSTNHFPFWRKPALFNLTNILSEFILLLDLYLLYYYILLYYNNH